MFGFGKEREQEPKSDFILRELDVWLTKGITEMTEMIESGRYPEDKARLSTKRYAFQNVKQKISELKR